MPPNLKDGANVGNNMGQLDGANRKMWQIDQDGANVGNEMMKSLNDRFPTFPTFPTLAPNSQTQKCPQLGEIRWGNSKKMGANVGNSEFPHMPQLEINFPH